MILYAIARFVTIIVVMLRFKVRYENLENVPKGGGFMLCSNHVTNFDPTLLAIKITPHIRFMAKEELFKPPLGWILKGIGTFPVTRGKGDTSAIDFAASIIKNGNVLGMFPEGTRSKDGVLQKAKSGAALIVSQSKCDVMPVGITFERPIKFRSNIVIRYGKLISYKEFGFTVKSENGKSPSEIKSCSRHIMEKISELVG